MIPCKKRFANILSKVVLAIAVGIIGVLAIPICLFLLPIILIWKVTNKLLCLLERM